MRTFLVYVAVFAPLMAARIQARAQNAYPYRIAQDRMIWHDKINSEQQRLLKLGGSPHDSLIRVTKDENVNLQITDALIRQVDELRERIEFDSTLNSNSKKRYLRGLVFLLQGYNQAYTNRSIQPSMAPVLIAAYKKAMELDEKGQSIEPVIAGNSYSVGLILVECFLLPGENIGEK